MNLVLPAKGAAWGGHNAASKEYVGSFALMDRLRNVTIDSTAEPGEPVLKALSTTTLQCQPGGVARSGRECIACTRFVDGRWNGSSLLVRCRWRELDRVEDVMSMREAIPVVRLSATLSESRGPGEQVQLVTDRTRVVGLLSHGSGLREVAAEEPVRMHMRTPVPVVRPRDTLGEALWQLRYQKTRGAAVVDGERVLGLVTLDQLVAILAASLSPAVQGGGFTI